MREIQNHKVNQANDAISIRADERDPRNGNASHRYELEQNPGKPHAIVTVIQFQHGPIAAVGVNGLTNEVLLAVLIDRMEGFQSSEFACEENQRALVALMSARDALFERTRGRMARGVEGTHEK